MENIPNTAMPPSKLRWLWLTLAGIVLVLFALGGYLAVTSLPALYSPPDRVRSNTDYDKKMNPPKVKPMDAAALPAKPVITISTNSGRVRLEHAVINQTEIYPLTMGFHRLDGTNTVTVNGTSVSLKHIGYAQMNPGQYRTNSYQYDVPGQFYYPNLQPLTEEETTNAYPHTWERSLDCEAGSPTYRFVLDVGPGSYQFLSAQIFDARTHRSQTQGWSSQQNQSHGQMVTMRTAMWHQAPVEVVIDLALGKPEIEEIEPVAGASFRYGNSTQHLIYAGDVAEFSGWSSSSGSQSEHVELSLPKAGQKKPHAAFVFVGVPSTSFHAIDFEFLDKEGKPLSTGGGGSSGAHIIKNLEASAAEVKKIRVTKHLEAHRFVFSLPRLPGVLPGNEKMGNLFAVRIPFVAFREHYEQVNFLQRITQLDAGNALYNNIQPGSYPRTFTNTTPAEILADYARLLNVKGELYVNQETLKIEERKPFYLEVRNKVRDFWKKIKGP